MLPATIISHHSLLCYVQPDPANDTDVVEVLPSLQELGLQKSWITFGYGTHQSCIGQEKTSGFHASGFDVVSAFHGSGIVHEVQ